MTTGAQKLAGAPLPALREDLRLSQGQARGGDPGWLIYDPLQHRYHEVSALGHAALAEWRAGARFADMAQAMSLRLGRAVALEEVAATVRQFDAANLLAEPLQGVASLVEAARAQRKHPLAWLLHNYLFMRWPLVRPQRFLDATLPLARAFVSGPALTFYLLATAIGLYLASRQWDAFQGAFVNFLSLEGAAGYLVAIAIVKTMHEFGHAYTAAHFGCRVPTMGVALMVLTPVLYTDVTDAWRLRDRRQRALIDAAGILVELTIAGLATAAWAILPEGAARSAAFFVAAVSWVMSLAINLNPFMRYDAYYLLSDALDIPNLQPRAFAMMRWRLRELLFGLGRPCPETWSAPLRAFVVAYGVATAIYRLTLFVAIAVMVYYLTFKALGVLLFLVEIIWFVARPVWLEMRLWWTWRRDILRRPRTWISATSAGLVAILFFIPWSTRIEVEAILEATQSQRLTAVAPAEIVAVLAHEGETVTRGQELLRLRSERLASDIALAETRMALVRVRLDRRGVDAGDRGDTLVLEGEESQLAERIAGLKRQNDDLVVRAQIDGVLVDMPRALTVGRVVERGEELGSVVAPQPAQLRGYVTESAAARLKPGAAGRFIPDDVTRSALDVRLASVAPAASAAIEIPYLLAAHGGRIAANEDRAWGALPVEAQFLSVMTPQQPVAVSQIARGLVRLDGEAESFFRRTLRRALSIAIRESSF